MKTALIAGASGLVGRALVERLENDPEWRVIGLARRPPAFPTRARFIQVDLLDPADCAAKLGGLGEVTHVFFTAIVLRDDVQAKVRDNLALLTNLMGVVLPAAKGLRHVQLMQGTNWYGNHVGPYKTPAREDDPRILEPMFYYPQQDWLAERQRGQAWTWSALRPQGVYGVGIGNQMNHLNALALFGAISAEFKLPLRFPGKPGAFTGVYQWTDAKLLARAMLWAATAPAAAAANQAFNVTNGDVDRWCNLWPAIADFFRLEPGPVQTIGLAATMADKEPLWAAMVARHGLTPTRMADLANWAFADGIYAQDYDHVFDLTKIRQAGWHEVQDSEAMLLRQLAELRALRIIP